MKTEHLVSAMVFATINAPVQDEDEYAPIQIGAQIVTEVIDFFADRSLGLELMRALKRCGMNRYDYNTEDEETVSETSAE